MNTELMVAPAELSVVDVRTQVNKIQELMKSVMEKDVHFGVIPGTPKPTLYKAGAEKLGFIFRMAPEFAITMTELPEGHREYQILGTLRHIGSGIQLAQGVGMCSTMESKYRWREAKRKCPKCGVETIYKSKDDHGGWYCWAKKGGCGAKFKNDDQAIVKQKTGRIENPDIADVYNTVLKIAKKRCYVDMTITACAASDVLTQDIEDLPHSPEPEVDKKTDPPPQKTTEEKTDQGKAPERFRQHIVADIVELLKNEQFLAEDRALVKATIETTKTNIALEAVLSAWESKLDKLKNDSADIIHEESTKKNLGEDSSDPVRQIIIDEIDGILKHEKFSDKDRITVKSIIIKTQTNAALEALRDRWSSNLNRLIEGFIDDDIPYDPIKSTDNDSGESADQEWWEDGDKPEKKEMEKPDIY
jgi:hypothetical protein